MAGKYPGIVKTKLNGVNQLDYLTGKSEKSARDTFFYYGGLFRRQCATRTGKSTSPWHPSRNRWPDGVHTFHCPWSTTSGAIHSRAPSVSNRKPFWVRAAHLPDQ